MMEGLPLNAPQPYPAPEHGVRRVAMLSVHTCPLAMLGGKKTGGMNVYVRELSRALGNCGIQVDVFTRSQDDCQPRVCHDLGDLARVIHVPAGPEEPIPVVSISEHLDEFVQGVLSFKVKEAATYDLIHSHYWLSGLVAEQLRAGWSPQIPIVHMFHTLGHMKNRIALNEDQQASPERINGETHVLSFADRIVVSTPAEEAQLNWLYGANMEKVVTIPPGVDLERFHPIPKEEAKRRVGIPPADRNIIFAGRIEPLKGIDTLLRAIALIQKRRPTAIENVCVAIIGGDPWSDDPDDEMARLQSLRENLGIRDLVTFLGSKDQEILPYYYAAAEMVVMPSHYESFGLVALEAMATGTPVIASEVGGLAFLVQDNRTGYHVPSRDPEALADRIYRLLSDHSCRQALGHNAQAYARQYAWPRITARILDLYSEVHRERNSAPES
ncbi:MAG TPA: glycosyltransferase [Candidatus Sulfomarinibacteraceae bacterium]|nr:glycosyltransferase [Candidatus Sulfomarinibacteraceae bacterium]